MSRKILGLLLLLGACGKVNFTFESPGQSGAGQIEYQTAYSIRNGAESRYKLGGRYYLVSHLKAVFGALTGIQMNLLLNNFVVIGGNEDFNEFSSTTRLVAESNPVDMSARQAIVIRTCHAIVQDDVRVLGAVTNTLDVTGAVASARFAEGPTSEEDIVAAYKLFVPGRDPSQDLIDALADLSAEAMKTSGATGKEGWRFLFLALCLDPAWQLL